MEPQEINKSDSKDEGFVEQIITDTNSPEPQSDSSLPLTGKQRLKYFVSGIVFLGIFILFSVLFLSYTIGGALSGTQGSIIGPLGFFFLIVFLIAIVKSVGFVLKGFGISEIHLEKVKKPGDLITIIARIIAALVLANISVYSVFALTAVFHLYDDYGWRFWIYQLLTVIFLTAFYYNLFRKPWTIARKVVRILQIFLVLSLVFIVILALGRLVF
jgi:hypothetical protein